LNKKYGFTGVTVLGLIIVEFSKIENSERILYFMKKNLVK